MVAWLEQEGLVELNPLAREQGLDGSVLLALYDVRADSPSFGADCSGLGVNGLPLQLKLKGKLVALFGKTFPTKKKKKKNISAWKLYEAVRWVFIS